VPSSAVVDHSLTPDRWSRRPMQMTMTAAWRCSGPPGAHGWFPQPVIAEVCYLLELERGIQPEAGFLRSFGGAR
jgi:hypothetical protein